MILEDALSMLGSSRYNANKMEPEEVANLYVRSVHLEKLLNTDNVVVTGPRGSGKTTLMKMLTRRALDNWKDSLAQRFLERPVLSIYFGSDSVIRSQLEVTEMTLTDGEVAALNIVRRSKLATQFFQIILDTVMHELGQSRAQTDEGRISEALTTLARRWKLTPPFFSIEALRGAAEDRIQDASTAIHAAADGDGRWVRRLSHEWRLPGLADAIVETKELLVDALPGLPGKWVLLFDELEYLSEASQREVLNLIRSLPSSFGVKLAVTPLSLTASYLKKLEQSYMHAGHDYRSISLGYQDTAAILSFSQALHSSVLGRLMKKEEIDLPRLFGVSPFAPREAKYRSPDLDFLERPSDDELIHDLMESQPRFAHWASRRGIDTPQKLASLTGNERAARLRQPMPIMLLWRERLKSYVIGASGHMPAPQARDFNKRSRKSRAVYAGYPTYLLLADGNPRVILNMLDDLIKLTLEGEQAINQIFFPPHVQSEAAHAAMEAQLSLANVYLSSHGPLVHGLFALDLLNAMGKVFEENVYFSGRFHSEPATLFRVDKKVSPRLGKAIVDMVYTGALVDVTTKAEAGSDVTFIRPSDDLIGRRFRLSYLLSVEHWLPIRIGKEIDLSTLFRRIGVSDRQKETLF